MKLQNQQTEIQDYPNRLDQYLIWRGLSNPTPTLGIPAPPLINVTWWMDAELQKCLPFDPFGKKWDETKAETSREWWRETMSGRTYAETRIHAKSFASAFVANLVKIVERPLTESDK